MKCPTCKESIPDKLITSAAGKIWAKRNKNPGPKRSLPTCPKCGKRFRRRAAVVSHRCPGEKISASSPS